MESTTNSKMFNNFRASPPANCSKASVSSTWIFSLLSFLSFSIAKCKSFKRSSLSNAFNTYTWQRDNRAAFTSNEGFSVVAPISVIMPFSTALSNASCCDLLNRWISSMNSIVLWSLPAFSITCRTSFTPALTALSVWNGAFTWFAMILANAVFPTPGGPQNIMDGIIPEAMAFRKIAPSPTKWSCPIKSSRAVGLSLSGSGSVWSNIIFC